MDIYVSPEAKSNIRRMTAEANEAHASYGTCDEVVEMLKSTLNVINQVIQLGGRIRGGDDSMPLNGCNEFIQYGVAIHDRVIPQRYYESAREMYSGELTGEELDAKVADYVAHLVEQGFAPHCKTYGVHS